MKIVFWQDVPSPHQASAIRHLSLIDGNVVTCIFAHKSSEQRKSIGWTIPDFGNSKLLFLESIDSITLTTLLQDTTAYHIVSGLFTIQLLNKPLSSLIKNHAKIIIMAECGNGFGIRKYFAWLKWICLHLLHDNKITAYLAMGQKGISFFKSVGAAEDKIFPYVYQVDCSPHEPIPYKPCQSENTFRLLYIGQFIERKGIDVLLKSVGLIKNWKFQLDLVGDGPEMSKIKKMVEIQGLTSQVKFHGIIKTNNLDQVIPNYDCLVVPSRYDGWAAVTNEAIQCGIPVVVSDGAGSVDLVTSSGAGRKFKSDDYNELASILKNFYDNPEELLLCHLKCRVVADSISGKSVALYFQHILEFLENKSPTRPIAPWIQLNIGNELRIV